MFLILSKFHQERFILFNKNEHGIKIIQGNKVQDLDNIEGIKIEQEYGYFSRDIRKNVFILLFFYENI
ncbi:protein phosphatase [Rickettsia endosymbiont of Ixodes scapularis]|nr:protein phosphatase [Rickettsia endosymbiont of Ixodes scapularis]